MLAASTAAVVNERASVPLRYNFAIRGVFIERNIGPLVSETLGASGPSSIRLTTRNLHSLRLPDLLLQGWLRLLFLVFVSRKSTALGFEQPGVSLGGASLPPSGTHAIIPCETLRGLAYGHNIEGNT